MRVIALLAVAAAGALAAAQQAQAPTFRTRTTLRAVEVRVVDQRGRPIVDLKQEDFRIFEDGKPQDIRVFASISLDAASIPEPGVPALLPAGSRPSDLSPSGRRVFLIVLGRGNLQIPSKGIDGMIHLVRDLLLPQDLVAVLAWNRATDFTQDHERIAQMLERYKAGHPKIEALLAQHFSGLAAIYGTRDMPASMEKEIAAVLRGPDQPSTRQILPEGISTAAIDRETSRTTGLLLGTAGFDVFGKNEVDQLGMTLDEYVANNVQSLQDLTRIYSGLAYLRHVDGEKHLFYVSPCGLHLPSSDDDKGVARVAQDARVVIDIFHSGGICGMWDVSSSEIIAEQSGGQYTGVTYGAKFADKVDAATRGGYQLGYYPADSSLDSKYRKVTVKVNRRGAQLLYRHGYFAAEEVKALDRRTVISQSRVAAALRYGQEVGDLTLAVTATPGKSKAGQREMIVQVNVDAAGVKLTADGADRLMSLDVAVFCVDRQTTKSYVVGQVWQRVEIRLNDERYDQFIRRGIGFTVHVPLRRSANMVKAVVYDYAADRVGTAMPKIK